jgi:hypothetical protein
MAKKKKKSSFRGKTRKDVENQQNRSKGSNYLVLPRGVELYKPTPGKTETFDIIPYLVSIDNHPDRDEDYDIALEGEPWYKFPFRVHRDIGGEGITVICPSTFGDKCPICENKKQLLDDGEEWDDVKHLNYSQRALYVVKPIDVKDHEEEFHVFDFSEYNFQTPLNEAIEEDEDNEDFPDLEDGKTLEVKWKKRKIGKNTYAEAVNFDFLKRDYEYEESVLKEVPCLDQLLKVLSYEKLSTLFFDGVDEADDASEEKAPAKRKKKSTMTKKKKEEEPEDDLTWNDLNEMEAAELSDVIDSKKLDIDIDDYNEEDELRQAVIDELGLEKPKKDKSKKTPRKTTTRSKGKCPHGHKFGKDTDEKDACDKCKIWDDCSKEYDKNN